MQRPHRHARSRSWRVSRIGFAILRRHGGSSGCTAGQRPWTEMAPLLRRWRWPWNERPWAQLDVDERGIEGGYIASVGNALKANNFDVEGSTSAGAAALLRNTRVYSLCSLSPDSALMARRTAPGDAPPRAALAGRKGLSPARQAPYWWAHSREVQKIPGHAYAHTREQTRIGERARNPSSS